MVGRKDMKSFVENCLDLRIKVAEWNPRIHTNISAIQEKKNGYFLSVIMDGDCNLHVLGKKEDYSNKIRGIEHLGYLFDLPYHTCVFGELYIPNKPATDVITAINEGWPDLKFCGFAIPVCEGEDYAPCAIDEINVILQELNIDFPMTLPWTICDTKEFLLSEVIRMKFEGFVLKESHMSGWYKLKPIKTCDVIITGWERSYAPQFYGELGALNISIYDKNGKLKSIGKVGGGFTPTQRAYITAKDINRVIEVAYQDVQSKGGLQFPRFMRFRDEKSPIECTEDQLC
jgi:ATP-dependent DNA ligase